MTDMRLSVIHCAVTLIALQVLVPVPVAAQDHCSFGSQYFLTFANPATIILRAGETSTQQFVIFNSYPYGGSCGSYVPDSSGWLIPDTAIANLINCTPPNGCFVKGLSIGTTTLRASASKEVSTIIGGVLTNDTIPKFVSVYGPPPDSQCYDPLPGQPGYSRRATCPDPPDKAPESDLCWHWDPLLRWWVDPFICGGATCIVPQSSTAVSAASSSSSGIASGNSCNPVTGGGTILVSGDPNDKLGAKGFGTPHYLAGKEPLRYSVLFENVPTASAAAATVTIKDSLSPSTLDLSTLKLGPITFSGQTITPPSVPLSSLGSYTANVNLQPAQNLGVRITASLDTGTGLLIWTFTTLNPATGLPPDDPLAGFLAPGAEGSVSYSVALKPGAATGAQITNKATIVFDANAPMDTPVWSNMIDSNAPTSRVSSLPPTQATSCFRPQWSGSDVGAGLKGFSVLVSDNGGPFNAWLTNSLATSGLFNGQPGHSYSFYSQAVDLVGNVEPGKTAAEATTVVGPSASCNGRPSISGAVSSKVSSGTTMTLGVLLTNSGVGGAQAVNVNQITFRTLSGTGNVTLASPPTPISVGSLAAGGSTPITLTLNVPSTVKQFSITEAGALQDLAATAYSFSIAQSIIP